MKKQSSQTQSGVKGIPNTVRVRSTVDLDYDCIGETSTKKYEWLNKDSCINQPFHQPLHQTSHQPSKQTIVLTAAIKL